MKVRFARTETFDEIFEDADFQALKASFAADVRVRQFVPGIVKTYWKCPVTDDALRRYAANWAHPHRGGGPELAAAIAGPTELIVALYGRFGTNTGSLGRLRGAIIEGLVLAQLEPRYGQNQLVDNAVVSIEDDAGTKTYESRTTVDVNGWDGNVGECLDCKTRTKWVDLDLLLDLEGGLPDPEFRIALVTADSAVVMADTLSRTEYRPSSRTTLIPLERLVDLAPLHPVARAK
jgi:hypothetical protein